MAATTSRLAGSAVPACTACPIGPPTAGASSGGKATPTQQAAQALH
jgi:hypothetical protein